MKQKNIAAASSDDIESPKVRANQNLTAAMKVHDPTKSPNRERPYKRS